MGNPPQDDPSEIIANDPFWSQVRERHPDVNIVLLGDEADNSASGQSDSGELPDSEPDPSLVLTVPLEFDGWFNQLVREIVDGAVTEPARWSEGVRPELLDREGICQVDSIGEGPARQALQAAYQLLNNQQWSGIAPPTGMPRILASAVVDGRERQLQVVYAQEADRLIISAQWNGFNVGENAASAEVDSGR